MKRKKEAGKESLDREEEERNKHCLQLGGNRQRKQKTVFMRISQFTEFSSAGH